MEELVSKDRANLRAEWLKLFDRSALEDLLQLWVSKKMTPGEEVGQGSHFTAYRLRGRLAGLVLSIGKDEFINRPRFNGGEWEKVIQSLSRLNLPLVAPVECISIEAQGKQRIALVQMYGEGGKNAAALHWGDLKAQKETTMAGLKEAGLELADLPQIRCRAGVPFIVDYSDLRLLNR